MLKKFIVKGAIFLVSMIVICMLACNKDGELQKSPDVTVLGIKFNSAKAEMKYSAWLDGVKIADSLVAGGTMSKLVERKTDGQKVTIKSLDGKILIDTTLTLASPAADYVYLDLEPSAETDAKPQFFATGQQVIHEDSCKVGLLISTAKINEAVDITLYRYDYALNAVDRTPVYTFKNVIPGQLSEFATVLYNSPDMQYVMTVKYSRNGELFPGIVNNDLFDGDLYLNNFLSMCRTPGNGKTNVAFLVKLLEDSDYFYTSCVTEL